MFVVIFIMILLISSVISAAMKGKRVNTPGSFTQGKAPVASDPREGRILTQVLSESPDGDRELSGIEKRRIARQEESVDKSRIHQSIRSKQEFTQRESHEAMEEIHNLIVCGYPVKIPGDRDFIQEAQDFLSGLRSDSIFL